MVNSGLQGGDVSREKGHAVVSEEVPESDMGFG